MKAASCFFFVSVELVVQIERTQHAAALLPNCSKPLCEFGWALATILIAATTSTPAVAALPHEDVARKVDADCFGADLAAGLKERWRLPYWFCGRVGDGDRVAADKNLVIDTIAQFRG